MEKLKAAYLSNELTFISFLAEDIVIILLKETSTQHQVFNRICTDNEIFNQHSNELEK